jgi:hypothetical protein
MRLERKEHECDELNKKIEQLVISNNRYKETPMKDQNAKNFYNDQNNDFSDNVNKLNYNIYQKSPKENFVDNKKNEIMKDNNDTSQSTNSSNENKLKTVSTGSKSSALVC